MITPLILIHIFVKCILNTVKGQVNLIKIFPTKNLLEMAVISNKFWVVGLLNLLFF